MEFYAFVIFLPVATWSPRRVHASLYGSPGTSLDVVADVYLGGPRIAPATPLQWPRCLFGLQVQVHCLLRLLLPLLGPHEAMRSVAACVVNVKTCVCARAMPSLPPFMHAMYVLLVLGITLPTPSRAW